MKAWKFELTLDGGSYGVAVNSLGRSVIEARKFQALFLHIELR